MLSPSVSATENSASFEFSAEDSVEKIPGSNPLQLSPIVDFSLMGGFVERKSPSVALPDSIAVSYQCIPEPATLILLARLSRISCWSYRLLSFEPAVNRQRPSHDVLSPVAANGAAINSRM